MLQKRLTRPLLGYLGCMLENGLEVAELLHQLRGCLVSDPADTRNVVGRVTNQRQLVGYEFGSYTESFVSVLDAYPVFLDIGRTAATGVQQPDSGLHQLLEILVA